MLKLHIIYNIAMLCIYFFYICQTNHHVDKLCCSSCKALTVMRSKFNWKQGSFFYTCLALQCRTKTQALKVDKLNFLFCSEVKFPEPNVTGSWYWHQKAMSPVMLHFMLTGMSSLFSATVGAGNYHSAITYREISVVQGIQNKPPWPENICEITVQAQQKNETLPQLHSCHSVQIAQDALRCLKAISNSAAFNSVTKARYTLCFLQVLHL